MPSKTNKSRVRKASSKKSGFQFKWWMGLGLVVLVAVVGIAVIRFSNAANPTYGATVTKLECITDTLNGPTPFQYCRVDLSTGGSWDVSEQEKYSARVNSFSNGQFNYTCANISSQGYVNQKLIGHLQVGTQVTVAETGNFSGPSTENCPTYK